MGWIDLNADVGEGMPGDAALLEVVTSANVACGGHAGDDDTMRQTLRWAQTHGVQVGAHPGWPDRAHFGRRPHSATRAEVHAVLNAQIGALEKHAQDLGVSVHYVKLHGAMSNQAAVDPALANAVADVLLARKLAWLVMPQTVMEKIALERSVPHFCEAFADRTYAHDGTLSPRTQPGAVLHDATEAALRAVAMVNRHSVPLPDDAWLPARIHSLCVHGDNPQALAMASAVRAALAAAGWRARAFGLDSRATPDLCPD